MNARYQNGVVTAHCLGCGALATFEKPWNARPLSLTPCNGSLSFPNIRKRLVQGGT